MLELLTPISIPMSCAQRYSRRPSLTKSVPATCGRPLFLERSKAERSVVRRPAQDLIVIPFLQSSVDERVNMVVTHMASAGSVGHVVGGGRYPADSFQAWVHHLMLCRLVKRAGPSMHNACNFMFYSVCHRRFSRTPSQSRSLAPSLYRQSEQDFRMTSG
jgi:hypothetical protein